MCVCPLIHVEIRSNNISTTMAFFHKFENTLIVLLRPLSSQDGDRLWWGVSLWFYTQPFDRFDCTVPVQSKHTQLTLANWTGCSIFSHSKKISQLSVMWKRDMLCMVRQDGAAWYKNSSVEVLKLPSLWVPILASCNWFSSIQYIYIYKYGFGGGGGSLTLWWVDSSLPLLIKRKRLKAVWKIVLASLCFFPLPSSHLGPFTLPPLSASCSLGLKHDYCSDLEPHIKLCHAQTDKDRHRETETVAAAERGLCK